MTTYMRIVQNSSMAFHVNAKLLNFTLKLKIATGKWRINMVTWSFLPFAINVILNLSVFTDSHYLAHGSLAL